MSLITDVFIKDGMDNDEIHIIFQTKLAQKFFGAKKRITKYLSVAHSIYGSAKQYNLTITSEIKF